MKPVKVRLSSPPRSSFRLKNIRLESFEFNWHCHPEYEIMLMTHSKGKRFVGDSISYYEDGELVFIGSNLPHTLYSPAGILGDRVMHEAILIQFNKTVAGLDVARAPEFHGLQKLFLESSRGIRFHGVTRQLAAQRITKMSTQEGFDRLIQLLRTLNLLGKARADEREYLSSIEFNQTLKPTHRSRIDRVCTYLNQDYRRRLRLEQAAAMANMSVTAFSRFFKRSTGKTFVRYINELRVGQASKLLIESELSVAEICYQVGFNNVSNFNRRFRELQRMSPKEYRREFVVSH